MPANNIHVIYNGARLTSGTATLSIPAAAVNEKVRAGQPCILEVSRDRDGTSGALDGTVGIYGADLPNQDYQKDGQSWIGQTFDPGSGNAMIFDTNLVYAAFSNYNFLVQVGETFLERASSITTAIQWNVTDNGGLARITIGTTTLRTGYGRRVTVYKPTVNEILAVAANPAVRTEIVGKSVYWFSGTHATNNLSRTLAMVSPRA